MKTNWQTKKLGEVCEIFNGGTPDTKIAEFWGGDNLWITPKDMGKLDDIYVDDTGRKITDAGLKNSSAKILPINSIILSSRAPIGHLAINTKEIATNQGCKGIVPKKGLAALFLFYFLKNSVELLNSLGSGTTFKELSGSKLAEVKIPFPALYEQCRIVKILNEVFLALAKAKENAEKNLQNSRELFESYLQSVFANPGDGWEEKKIEEVCTVIAGQSPEGKYYNFSAKGLPFYQGKKEFTEKYIGEPTTWTTEITKEAVAGDILMSVRAPVGPVNFSTQKICIGRGLAAIRATKKIDIEFLFNFLVKHESEIVGNAGAVFASINKSQIESIQIPLPSLPEQRSIVAKLDALSLETKKLEAIYQQKLADLDELKKSVLRKAFEGEL